MTFFFHLLQIEQLLKICNLRNCLQKLQKLGILIDVENSENEDEEPRWAQPIFCFIKSLSFPLDLEYYDYISSFSKTVFDCKAPVLESVEYSFIAITPRSTLIWNSNSF